MVDRMSRIDAERLRAEVGSRYAVSVVPSTGSTNADLREAAAKGADDRSVLVAEEQTAGIGRRARGWASPKGAGLYLSVLLRPSNVPFRALGSLSLVAGVALCEVARGLGVDAVLKWPNDLLAGPDRAKCAGILAEAEGGPFPDAPDSHDATVVVGIGVNVLPLEAEPGPGGLPATSLSEHGATTTDRTEIAARLLRAFGEHEESWRATDGDLGRSGLLARYREECATLGRPARVILPNGDEFDGIACDVDAEGRLLLDLADGTRRTVSAGDVVHVRPR
jgi:BirA family biotin operon repressor/biotin-[acetyl-CoA-carboxylase] ligase